MSVELLYTSAQQGLKQGSRGFCTVISTAGMPLNMANRLESLSGYRHVYPPNSEDAHLNPVAFSHLKLSVGGRTVSILSRVADYGLDYSQRTNKIAHHVVLEPSELPLAGPAWLMQQPGIFRQQWDGECKTLGTGPTIPQADQSSKICRRWQSIVGDAGWAGVVAESLAQYSAKPTWIVFAASQAKELLSLIDEVIALLPARQRWEMTFSTYATMIPPDVDCRLRCVLAGTNEARLAPARGRVIDLSQPLPPIVTQTSWVQLARQGAASTGRSVQVTTQGVSNESPVVTDISQVDRNIGNESPGRSQSKHQAGAMEPANWNNDGFDLQLRPFGSATPPSPPKFPTSLEPVAVSLPAKKYSQSTLVFTASAATLLLGLGLVTWMLVRPPHSAQPVASSQDVDKLKESSSDANDKPSDVQSPTDKEHKTEEESSQTTGDTPVEEKVVGSQESLGKDTPTTTSNPRFAEEPTKNADGEDKKETMSTADGEVPTNDIATTSEKQEEQDSTDDDSKEAPIESRYCFDRVFQIAPIDWDQKKYWEGRFTLQGTIDTKVLLYGLYWKNHPDEPPRKIEHMELRSGIDILRQPVGVDNNRFTLKTVKVQPGKKSLTVLVDVNIQDDAFKSIVNALKARHNDWKSYVDDLNQGFIGEREWLQEPAGNDPFKILSECGEVLRKLSKVKSDKENANPPDRQAIDSLQGIIEGANERKGEFNQLFDQFNDHQKRFNEQFKGGNTIDFSDRIFISEPIDGVDNGWREWEPLIIKLKPSIPSPSTNSMPSPSPSPALQTKM